MARSVNFSFKTADNKSKTIRINNFEGDLTADLAKEFMDTMVNSKQFMKAGFDQYATAVAAHVVDTETTVIYEAAKETGAA